MTPLTPARNWKEHPPTTREETFQFMEWLAQCACDHAFAVTGQLPHHERRASSVVIVWPDGEITNELELETMQ
ncbi:MAG: hypothetical protein IT508_12530 [Burkholderiaceae bacterium]|nr:hypothetical protein [Burkholderiaceae bacterium]